MMIEKVIKESKKVLMQYWPLGAFIASNPLWGLREMYFFDAVSNPLFNGIMSIDYYQLQYEEQKISHRALIQAIELIEKRVFAEVELNRWITESFESVENQEINILLAEQLVEYEFQNPKNWIKERIFGILRDYFGLGLYRNSSLFNFWITQSKFKQIMPDDLHALNYEKLIEYIINEINIPEEIISDYMQAIYLQVYGWSSLMNWRNHHSDNPWIPGEDPCEIVILMWLFYEYVIKTEEKLEYKKISLDKKNRCIKSIYIWQTAFELDYIQRLELKLNKNFIACSKKYDAQFIFCIDTRSEGMRRHIESKGNYQTFGFAGFFGVIFKLNAYGKISYQAPALVEASNILTKRSKKNKLWIFFRSFTKVINSVKKQLASPFALFEMIGFWFVFFMIYKNFQPMLPVKLKSTETEIKNTLPFDEQFQAAYNLLTSVGLIDNFSEKVLICAHQSDNINNPFKASLNCGACGGNSGVPNAIVICQILNNMQIRLRLKQSGIDIPQHTQFIPACHHTSYDRLEILQGEVPNSLRQAINCAAKDLRAEKIRSLPGKNLLSYRENNWSELIPELGLINNTAIIIAPRELTLNQNLERRTFLHSYDPNIDKNGDILKNILAAPVIVAHWISSQYYFSTVNPELFGAGNKAIHNVLPGIGVLEGNLSDLKIGLPLQSTHFESKPIHEPRRIVVVVYAYKKILDHAIDSVPAFKTLLTNEWIYLKHIEAK